MNLQLHIINPINYPRWDNLLLSTNDYSFFHSSAWAKVLSESYQYTPTYFTLFDSNNLLVLIPVMEVKSFLTGRRGVSLPFTDYCDPIIDERIQSKDVIDYIIKYGKKSKWKVLEIRSGALLLNGVSPSLQFLGHHLDLSQNEERIFSSFKDSTRRNIKKAITEGVEVKILNSLESVKEFFTLNCITRKYHGLPPQPYRFFEKVYDHIISRNLGSVAIAYYKEKAIAGAIYFHFGGKAIYKYGASDRKYLHLRANNLVMWEAIKWYCHNGYKNFCFGRTEPDNQGLKQFKMGWGTKENVISYYKFDFKRDAFIADHQKVSKLQQAIFRKMPIPLLNIFGSLLYRHMA
jgi:hypothetical protein